VSAFDFGEQDSVCYYAMQYIGGVGLVQVLDEVRRLPPQEIVREEIARARSVDQTTNKITESRSAVNPQDRSGGDAPRHGAPADR
jgi:hypothetical protein